MTQLPVMPAIDAPRDPSAGLETGTIGLGDLGRMLWRRRLLILLVTALVTGVAALVVGALPPVYTSQALVQLSGPPATVQVTAGDVRPTTALEPVVGNHVSLLTSPDMLARLADRLDLMADPLFNPALAPARHDPAGRALAWGRNLLGLDAPLSEAAARAGMMKRLRDSLEVGNPRGTHVIAITAHTPEPALSATLANTLAALALDHVADARTRAEAEEQERVQAQAATLRAEFDAAERALEAKRRELGLFEGAQNAILAEQLSSLTVNLVEAGEDRAAAEANLSRASSLLRGNPETVGPAALGDVLDSAVIADLRGREAEAARRVTELSARYGPRHPALQAAVSELETARESIRAEVARVTERLRNEVEVDRRREAALLTEKQALEARIDEQLADSPALNLLKRDVETAREAYSAFLTEGMRSLRVVRAGEVRMDLLSPATPPLEPAGPPRTLLLLLAGIVGAGLGVLAALLRENADAGIRSAREAEAVTGYPTLAMIPTVTGRLYRQRPENIVLREPRSIVSEAVRNLFTSLGFLGRDGQAPRTILVTSSLPDEGKTMVALSLARQAALAGQRVICVDLDLRQPQRRHMDEGTRADATALPVVISGDLTARYFEEEETGLAKLMVGAEHADRPVPLDAPQIHSLLLHLGREFDLVVVDSPPVLCFADAALIASLADTTLYMVRWGRTGKDTVQEGLRRLALSRARIGGVVLTRLNPAKHAQYGYGDSGIYHGRNLKYHRRAGA